MKFEAFEKGIEVNGTTIWAVIDGMGNNKYLGIQILEEEGLKDVIEKKDEWYLQEKWLKCFEKIEETIGNEALFRIGTRIPFNAVIPIEINDIKSALNSIDKAYHINHRNSKGEILFDPSKGKENEILEGIGHYELLSINENMREAFMKCKNPYPCDFDMGILISFCKLGGVEVLVEHKDLKICRKKQKDYCIYKISW